MAANHGGAAFPSFEREQEYDENAGRYRNHYRPMDGMTLRDYFAGQAIMSMVADAVMPPSISNPDWAKNAARNAYALADAMLAEREKGGA